MEHLAFKKMVAQKFNGTLVSELTELTNQDLGKFMKHLKEMLFFDKHVIMYQPQEKINQTILKEFEKWQN